ncbi:MAG: hypothetical protein MRY21_06345 [Simkaniaceae bacterium]|nr:hypothetical protein [Simkaniaceae bacterium]
MESVSNTTTHQYNSKNYREPLNNSHQRIQQVALYVIASLAAAALIAVIATCLVVSLNPITAGITIPLTALSTAALFYFAAKTGYKADFSKLFVSPYGGLYEGDFFAAVNANQPSRITPSNLTKRKSGESWAQAKTNYEAFITDLKSGSRADPTPYKIPQNIHLIWLGATPPEGVRAVFQTWVDRHEGWNCKLWGNDDARTLIDEVGQEFPNVKETFDRAEKFSEKADVLRLAILYKQGGFYADTDLPCFGSLEGLHRHSNFYSCIEQNDRSPLQTCNAAIGSSAGHQVIREALQNVRPRRSGEGADSILHRTGPVLLSNKVRDGLKRDKDNGTTDTLVLPSGYFFPLPWKRTLIDKGGVSPEKAASFVLPWTKGLHLWEGTWKA